MALNILFWVELHNWEAPFNLPKQSAVETGKAV